MLDKFQILFEGTVSSKRWFFSLIRCRWVNVEPKQILLCSLFRVISAVIRLPWKISSWYLISLIEHLKKSIWQVRLKFSWLLWSDLMTEMRWFGLRSRYIGRKYVMLSAMRHSFSYKCIQFHASDEPGFSLWQGNVRSRTLSFPILITE
jgi:hypothetical protein